MTFQGFMFLQSGIGFLSRFVIPCEQLGALRRGLQRKSSVSKTAKTMILMMLTRITVILTIIIAKAEGCGYPGAPSHSLVSFSPEVIGPDSVATYECESGFELLGPVRRVCNENNTWTPQAIPFCVLNVATGKAPMQSSIFQGGFPQKAVDGSTSPFFSINTCTQTDIERTPWWYVNLLEPYMIQLVRIDFGRPCCPNNQPATILVRVGNNRPDLGANPICGRYTGFLEEGRPVFIPCQPPLPGAFVSIHMETPRGGILSICEAFIYTDQALPIESCPSFRDQPLGSTATFNGKCYIFNNNQRLSFENARRACHMQGGSLVDETSPALQGFLSWELWRRHRNDPSGQYWMGAIRDPKDPKNWKWLNGQDVTSSFWNLPGGNDNCSRFDGTKEWLWSDTNCNLNLNYICQYRPRRCGIPARPPNSTVLATDDFTSGTMVQYVCAPGHILIGSNTRACLPNGFYTESVPTCKYLECGLPVQIPNGRYRLLNGTRYYQSVVRYSCNRGYSMMGESELTCDVRRTWDGPPPRCEQVPGIGDGGDGIGSSNGDGGGSSFSSTTSLPSPARIPVITITIPPPPKPEVIPSRPEPETDVAPLTAEDDEDGLRNEVVVAENNANDDRLDATVAGENAVEDISTAAPVHFIRPYFPDPTLPETHTSDHNISRTTKTTTAQVVRLTSRTTPPPTKATTTTTRTQPTTTSTTTTTTTTTTTSTKPPPTIDFNPYATNILSETLVPASRPTSSTPQSLNRRPVLTSRQPAITVITTTLAPPRRHHPDVIIHHTEPAQPSLAVPGRMPSRTTSRKPPARPTATIIDEDRPPYRPPPRVPSSPTPYVPSRQPTFNPDRNQAGSIISGQEMPPKPIKPQPPPPPPPKTSQPGLHYGSSDSKSIVDGDQNLASQPKANLPGGEVQEEGRSNTRLNLGGIIALSVFGGFVVLAALTTVIVILCRRSRRSGSSSDNTTISTDDSLSSESRGLNKYYKRAWENLRSDPKGSVSLGGGGLQRLAGSNSTKQASHATLNRRETLDNPNYRNGTIEGLRDTNEMTVNDATAWNTRADRKDKKHHHHHHHHHHHNHGMSHRRSGSPDSIDGREDGVASPWQNRHRRA